MGLSKNILAWTALDKEKQIGLAHYPSGFDALTKKTSVAAGIWLNQIFSRLSVFGPSGSVKLFASC